MEGDGKLDQNPFQDKWARYFGKQTDRHTVNILLLLYGDISSTVATKYLKINSIV